jgi:cold shock CspA family protein
VAPICWTQAAGNADAAKHAAPHNLPNTYQQKDVYMSVTKTGRVKMIRESFAFLTANDDSGDCFVHSSVIERAGLSLAKGDLVRYEIEPSARGPKAISIALAS